MTAPIRDIEEALRGALAGASRGEVRFARDFQGFPGTVHGGAVAALFFRTTTPSPPVHLQMDLVRGVPTETTLRLEARSVGSSARLSLSQGDRRLAEAALTREPELPAGVGDVFRAWRKDRAPEGELPATTTCLACGTENPIGLRARFHVNRRFLWREYAPPPAYRAADGSLHAALVTVMLDELGWWLGALTQRECGVTTELTVTVGRRLPFAPVLALGDRGAVHPDEDPRGRYVRAVAHLLTPEGEPLAMATVRFAGSPAYTRRLLQPFLETTAPAELFRIFPSAPDLTERSRPP